jgi:2'-5' RNA ligase
VAERTGAVAERTGAKPGPAAAKEPRSLRLFVAVDVPDDVRDALASAIEPLRGLLPKAKWIPPESWHVTLKFLGSVPPATLDAVVGAVGEAAEEHTAFRARLSGVGAFPSSKRARVVWAGVEGRHDELASLARSVDRALEFAFPKEERPFAAHLTLARLKEQARLPDELAGLDVTSRPFRVGTVRLYRSHLQRPAARYEVLRQLPLRD